jgi:hypothetical protein
MYLRLVDSWVSPEQIPKSLTHLEVIHWCLAPLDWPDLASGRLKVRVGR